MTGVVTAGLTQKQAAQQDLKHANYHLEDIANDSHDETVRVLVHVIAHLRDAVATLIREMPDDD